MPLYKVRDSISVPSTSTLSFTKEIRYSKSRLGQNTASSEV